MDPFRYGLYGVGRIGTMHGILIQKQGAKLIAIGDDVSDALSIGHKALGQPDIKPFTDPDEMAQAIANKVDGVIIASLTRDHARHALPFIQAGIPIYLEKPLTETLGEAFDFVEQVGTAPHLLQVGLQRRYDPALLYTKALLTDGLIGEVREIRCVLRDQFPPPETFSSGGLIIDMGIHVADEAIFLLDEFPNSVWATVHHTKGYTSTVDEDGDTAFVTFTTPSGVLGRLDLSRTHVSGYNNETYIIGTQGTLHTGRFAGYPGPIHVELWQQDGCRHPSSQTFEMTRMDAPRGSYPEFLPRFATAYGHAHEAFRHAITTGSAFTVTQNEGLDAQVFVEAAHRSAQQEGTPISLQRHHDIAAYRRACVVNDLLLVNLRNRPVTGDK